MDTARLEWHLLNWARWMRSRGLSNFHVRAKSVGEGFTHYDTDGEYEKSDAWVAENVDAIIRDLKRLERAALECEYLGAAWLEKIDIGLILVVAREGVRMGLNRRGIV